MVSLHPLAVLLLMQPGVPEALFPLGHVAGSCLPCCLPRLPGPVQTAASQQILACIIARGYSCLRARLHIFPSCISWRSYWVISPAYLGLFDWQIQGINWSHTPGVTQKLDRSSLCYLLQVTDRDVEQDRSLCTVVLHFLPASINHYPLRPII